MTATINEPDVNVWRDAMIDFALETDISDESDYARIGMALHDCRIRDSLMWYAIEDNASTLYRVAMSAAQHVPEKMRAPALCLGSVCAATLGNEQLAVACANWAYIADPSSHMAVLLILTAKDPGLVDGVPLVIGSLTYEECRYGSDG